jgi:intracellular sulfur oxidation DsrE/DsrF family protein
MKNKIITLCWVFYLMHSPAAEAQDLKAFVALDNGNESEMGFAISFAKKLCEQSAEAKFELLAGGQAVVIFSASKSPHPDDMNSLLSACPQFKFYACEETVNKMLKAGEAHQPDFFEPVETVNCTKHFKELTQEGYFRISTEGT